MICKSPVIQLFFVLLFIGLGFSFFSAKAQSDNQDTLPKINLQLDQAAINFLVVGDWGRNGSYHQKEVAEWMEYYADKYHAQFMVSTGDNIYETGVKDVNDPAWLNSFENIYTGPHLQKPWYIALGNHDYRGTAQAEINYSKKSKRWTLPARYYAEEILVGPRDSIKFIFIDSSPFIKAYYTNPQYIHTDLVRQDTAAQLRWIESQLSSSKARWKFVVSHHPVLGVDKKDRGTKELKLLIKPKLEKYHAQLFICGHIHTLQHLMEPGGSVNYIISGAGSKTSKAGFVDGLSKFNYGESGFTMVSVSPHQARVYMVNYKGEVMYSTTINP